MRPTSTWGHAAASLAGGFASDAGILIGARVVQGLGGALLFPATLALISTNFTVDAERNRAFALWGTAGASGVIVGAMAGGLLTSFLGREWVFFVNVPLCIGAVFVLLRVIPQDPARTQRHGSFDIPGALLATVGSTLLVYGLISGPEVGWQSLRTIGVLTLGVFAMVVFLIVERFTRDPLAPLRMFTIRSLIIAMAIVFVFQGAINALHYLFFVDLQNVLGYTPLAAGLAFLPISVCAMFGSGKVLPFLLNRWGIRPALFIGMLGVGASMIVMSATMSLNPSYWILLPAVILWGLFAGMLYPAMFAAAGADAKPTEHGVASALAQTSAQIGGALGLAALIAMANMGLDLSAGGTNAAADVLAGLRTAALVGGVAAVAAAFLALLIKKPARQEEEEASAEMAAVEVAPPVP